jgi:hypothetical protein
LDPLSPVPSHSHHHLPPSECPVFSPLPFALLLLPPFFLALMDEMGGG